MKPRLFQTISAMLVCALFSAACRPRKETGRRAAVETVQPVVIRTIRHDTSAFTQGLIFDRGMLLESTGLYGRSSLRRLDAADGAEKHKTALDARLFGEGLALRNGRLVQLTWKEGRALVYSPSDFTVVGAFTYAGEGWGLASWPEGYIMSNGSDTLYFRNDEFAVVRVVRVTFRGAPLTRLNELEYARGKVYANVWYSNYIFEIDPHTGVVRRSIDCSDLAAQAGMLTGENVLNGIAYDESAGRFYITGKNWPLIFEVSIP